MFIRLAPPKGGAAMWVNMDHCVLVREIIQSPPAEPLSLELVLYNHSPVGVNEGHGGKVAVDQVLAWLKSQGKEPVKVEPKA